MPVRPGTYNLSGTGALSTAADQYIGYTGTGTFNQTGGTNTIADGKNLDIGSGAGSVGVYNLSGGSLTVSGRVAMGLAGGASVPARGTFNQTGGTIGANSLQLGGDVGSAGVYNQTGGVLTVGQIQVASLGSGTYTLSDAGALSAQRLTIGGPGFSDRFGSFDQTGGTNSLDTLALIKGSYSLSGGTLRFNTYTRSSTGTFFFNAGTIQVRGNRSIGTDPAIHDLFGSVPNIAAGKGLTVEGSATLLTSVTLDGGTFTSGSLTSASNLHLQRGTFNLTNQAVSIGGGGLLGGTLDLNDDMTVNVTLGITNQGLVTGDGQLGGTFTNAIGGELRGEPGRSLKLTGPGNANSGQINLLGGLVEFTQGLTNNAGGLISGNGSLIVRGGLVNHGTMNFSGSANVVGDVTNSATGKVISSGGGPTTFFDDVVNNGEIRTSPGGFTVFFGSLSGNGAFTGTGTVNIEGDLLPGNSPGVLTFEGALVLGPTASMVVELGGMAAGREYDQLQVGGLLSLDGTLEVVLLDQFRPTLGDRFDMFDYSALDGRFDAITLPPLPTGRYWDTAELYTSGTISVSAIPEPAAVCLWIVASVCVAFACRRRRRVPECTQWKTLA